MKEKIGYTDLKPSLKLPIMYAWLGLSIMTLYIIAVIIIFTYYMIV